MPDADDGSVPRIWIYPETDPALEDIAGVPLPRSRPNISLQDVAPQQGTLSTIIDNLLGTNGRTRYQTWPEKMLRNAITAPHNAINRPVRPKPNLPDLHSEGLDLQDDHLNNLQSGKPVHVMGHLLVPISHDPFSEEQDAA